MKRIFPALAMTLVFLAASTGWSRPIPPSADLTATDLGFGRGKFQRALRVETGPLSLASFTGSWVLAESQGLDCSPLLTVSVPEPGTLLVVPVDGQARPDFRIPQINGGELRDFTFGEGWSWSRAVGEAGRIYQAATIRSVVAVHTRLERELEALPDGSLVISASERRDGKVEDFRCIYYPPSPAVTSGVGIKLPLLAQ